MTVYLGDGLFVVDHGHQVELFAHNGVSKTDTVYLDPEVLAAFLQWVKERGE